MADNEKQKGVCRAGSPTYTQRPRDNLPDNHALCDQDAGGKAWHNFCHDFCPQGELSQLPDLCRHRRLWRRQDSEERTVWSAGCWQGFSRKRDKKGAGAAICRRAPQARRHQHEKTLGLPHGRRELRDFSDDPCAPKVHPRRQRDRVRGADLLPSEIRVSKQDHRHRRVDKAVCVLWLRVADDKPAATPHAREQPAGPVRHRGRDRLELWADPCRRPDVRI